MAPQLGGAERLGVEPRGRPAERGHVHMCGRPAIYPSIGGYASSACSFHRFGLLSGPRRSGRVPTLRRRQRSELNAARISVEKSSGSSQAAKWPPLSTSLK